MKVSIEKNDLVIRIPMTPPTTSPSGKTESVASSHGNQKTGQTIKDGREIIVGLNAYVKPVKE